jgi:hypothetical protein
VHSYIGLFLLSLAVAAGVYLGGHGADALRLPFPVSVKSNSASYASGNSQAGVPVHSSEYYSASFYYQEDSAATSRPAVRIYSLKFPSDSQPFTELALEADWGRNQTVNITGWTVRTQRGDFRIPQAQLIYEFGGQNQDIILKSGDIVKIYSGRGPKGNFRLNKCTGYLEDAAPFTPSLPRSCPYISYSEVKNYSQPCQDYLLSLNACQHPLANPPVPTEDAACFDFLKKLNYNSCVAERRNDEDFLDNEWRIWVDNQMDFLNSSHDRVQLLNKEGRIVDEYIY